MLCSGQRKRLSGARLEGSDFAVQGCEHGGDWAGQRRAAPAAEPVRPYLDALVESFEAQINAIEADIKTLCATCEPIAKAVNVLVAIPGVGQKTAAGLIALMPELGSLPRR
jgi:hypothetical protein